MPVFTESGLIDSSEEIPSPETIPAPPLEPGFSEPGLPELGLPEPATPLSDAVPLSDAIPEAVSAEAVSAETAPFAPIPEAPPIPAPEMAAPRPARVRKPFAAGFSFYKLFWIFFIGSFLGVAIETAWCLVTRGYFESRQGLIYGPFNLVYGFGAVFMTLGLCWLRKRRDLWVFLGGVLIGGGFEYLCSWVQETAFGSTSWQYDALPFNLDGRINLLYSIFWGILALLWVKGIYPWLSRGIEKIPRWLGIPLSWILIVFMAANSIVSGMAVARWAARQNGIPAATQVQALMDEYYTDDILRRVYPNMVFLPPPEQEAPAVPLVEDGE